MMKSVIKIGCFLSPKLTRFSSFPVCGVEVDAIDNPDAVFWILVLVFRKFDD